MNISKAKYTLALAEATEAGKSIGYKIGWDAAMRQQQNDSFKRKEQVQKDAVEAVTKIGNAVGQMLQQIADTLKSVNNQL